MSSNINGNLSVIRNMQTMRLDIDEPGKYTNDISRDDKWMNNLVDDIEKYWKDIWRTNFSCETLPETWFITISYISKSILMSQA